MGHTMNKNLYYKDALAVEREHSELLAYKLSKAESMCALLACCSGFLLVLCWLLIWLAS